ncbi:MAG: hypothetical protein WDO15_13115 [Bacteroidota bacterium]
MGYIVPIADLENPAMAAWREMPGWIRAEVIDKKIYILPRLSPFHAMVISDIFMPLINHVRENRGEVFSTSLGVFLKNGSQCGNP